ncbi:MAG: cation:proton antiporter [Gammaproteobacteria bacterium]|nr:cation:proton antiporter [Gammaproteobacteria bacterium]
MIRKNLSLSLILLLLLLLPSAVSAAQFHISHNDPIAPVILGVTGILFVALIGRFSARKLGFPSVIGELIMGIAVGNLAFYLQFDLITVLREGPAIFSTIEYMLKGENLELACLNAVGAEGTWRILHILRGEHGGEILQVAHTVDVFSRYGIIFLLFLVGIETSVDEMRKVGPDSSRVAVIGVLLPFLFGMLASSMLIEDADLNTSMFLGATLAATSVGITAMVLQEMKMEKTEIAHIILGAAVIDDVLGLLMLAIVSGIVITGSIDLIHISLTVITATIFLVATIIIGPYIIRLFVRMFCRLDIVEAKMFVSYLFVMLMAWMANLSGLATIVGAFAAGLILQDAYFESWDNDRKCPVTIKDLIMPLEVILVPIFFVLMGLQVKLETFLQQDVMLLAAGLLVAAVAGKLLSGFGALSVKNHFAIGIGMMPRGEVGLIFAAIGKSLGVLNDALFSAVVLMVIVTTLLAPPLFKDCLKRCQ